MFLSVRFITVWLTAMRKSSSFLPQDATSYLVQKTDSLAGIAAQFDTTTSVLKHLNRLMSDLVFPGQVLYVPNRVQFTSQSCLCSPESVDKEAVGSVDKTAFHLGVETQLNMAGHALPLTPISPNKLFLPPRPLDIDEVKRLNDQCDERFVKLHVKRILHDEVLSVSGVMLVTPDCVMFDADESSPLVLKNGSAMYSMIVPMKSVRSVSVYHENSDMCLDDYSMKSGKWSVGSLEEPHVTQLSSSDSMDEVGAPESTGHSDCFPVPSSITKHDVDNMTDPLSCVKTLADVERLNHGNSDSPLHTLSTHETTIGDPITKELYSPGHAFYPSLSHCEKNPNIVKTVHTKLDNTVAIHSRVNRWSSPPQYEAQSHHLVDDQQMVDSGAQLLLDNCDSSTSVSPSKVCVPLVQPVYLQDTTDLLLVINVSCSEKLDISKSDSYWYSVPYDKVDPLYAFFILWSHTNDEQSLELVDKGGFVVVNNSGGDSFASDNLPSIVHHSNSFSKDWEIVNVQELNRQISVVEIGALPLPDLSQPSDILEKTHLRVLMSHLPARAEGSAWTLVYSSSQHGFSLRTLYRQMASIDSPILLVIRDATGQVFGTMQSSAIKKSDLFYGTGESYLFSLSTNFKKYGWTGTNNFFTKGDNESLCFGASKGNYGLWLDGDLYHGRTQRCSTYNNDLLTVAEDFTIKCVEAWCFN